MTAETWRFWLRHPWCRLLGHDYEQRDYIGDGTGFDSGIVFCRRCEWAALEEDT